MQWLKRIKWGCLFIASLLTACNLGGRSMEARELFDPTTAALLENIRKGNESAAKEALAQGVKLNVHGKEGVTPLQWLILETRDKKAVTLGLKLGADPNFKNGDGNAAINMVPGFEDPDWLRIMLDAGGDPNLLSSSGQPPLFGAINEERWADIELLLERGGDINTQDTRKRNAALYAAYLNKYEIVYWLIEHGVQVEGYDINGTSLAWLVQFSESNFSKDAPQRPWLMKVKQVLEQKGVRFPPPSPQEVRAQWEKDKSK
ncbi:ankyrin repeat domain-containing protein [Lonsdalea quercina]|uniref:ankyrin repeat domain-containing protein n=1 Tax=Lonsdalea quercina TaxID=71657 RepID=UPI003974A454